MYFLWPRYLTVPDRRFLLTLEPVSSEETRPIGKVDDRRISHRKSNINRTVTMLSRDPGVEGRTFAPQFRGPEITIGTVRSIFNLRRDIRRPSIFPIGRVSSLETGSSVNRNLRSGTVRYLGQRKYMSLLN